MSDQKKELSTAGLIRNFIITVAVIIGIYYLLTEKTTKYKVGDCVVPTGKHLEDTENLLFMQVTDFNRMQYSVVYYFKNGEKYRKGEDRYISRQGLEENSYLETCKQEVIDQLKN